VHDAMGKGGEGGIVVAPCGRHRLLPRPSFLGRSAVAVAIAVAPPVAGARVSSLGTRRRLPRGEEEPESRMGERNRARIASGLASPGGRKRYTDI
jgi:hypothetical protein